MSDEWAGGESGELVYGEINDGRVHGRAEGP